MGARGPPQVDPYGCRVVAGDWTSRYDGVRTTDSADLEVDHVVVLAEAWDSGAAAWLTERRRAFATDLDDPGAPRRQLRLQSGQERRRPAQWQPPRRKAWCPFARDWIAVKVRCDLTADQAEIDTLRPLLDTCPADGR